MAKIIPEADGFKGFIEKGQGFNFTERKNLVFSVRKHTEELKKRVENLSPLKDEGRTLTGK